MSATLDQPELPWVPNLSPHVRTELASRIQPGWQADAACVGDDPGLFDTDEASPDKAREAVAKSICHDCQVRRSCLFSALLGDEYGIWGGHNDTDRDQIRHALARPIRRDAVLGSRRANETPTTKEAA